MALQDRKSFLNDISFLVAEPNGFMRTTIRRLLMSFGVAEVRFAEDGLQAINEIKIKSPDILMAELIMPKLGGLELLKEVRAMPDQNRFLPFIMMTTATDRANVLAARNFGVSEFIAKPITPAVVLTRIKEVIYRPRPFVDSSRYFGPDRRRRNMEGMGDERRGTGGPPPGAPVEEEIFDGALTQEQIDRMVAGDAIRSD